MLLLSAYYGEGSSSAAYPCLSYIKFVTARKIAAAPREKKAASHEKKAAPHEKKSAPDEDEKTGERPNLAKGELDKQRQTSYNMLHFCANS